MNINMNDLNIIPEPPESWQAKVSRLVTDVFLPYAVPYIIPAFLGWKLTRQLQLDRDGSGRIASLQHEVQDLKQQLRKYEGFTTITQQRQKQRLNEVYQELDTISKMLMDRQDIYCSPFKFKEGRKVIEKRLKEFVVSSDFEKELHMYRGMEEILEHDKHCGATRADNGCLMWVYMELWRIRARLNMQENVLRDIQGYDASKHK